MNLDEIINEQIDAHIGGRESFHGLQLVHPETIKAICRNVVAAAQAQAEEHALARAHPRGRVTVSGNLKGYGLPDPEVGCLVEIEIPDDWMSNPPTWLVEEARWSRRNKVLEERIDRAAKTLRGQE